MTYQKLSAGQLFKQNILITFLLSIYIVNQLHYQNIFATRTTV